MRLLVKYFRLSREEKLTVLQVGFLLVLARLGLALLPYRVIKRWFEKWSGEATRARDSSYQRTLTWAGSGLGRYILGDKPCLSQAIVVQALMRRAGLDSDLRIGVAKDEKGTFLAHAWLECDGAVILGGRRATEHYVRLAPMREGMDTHATAIGSSTERD